MRLVFCWLGYNLVVGQVCCFTILVLTHRASVIIVWQGPRIYCHQLVARANSDYNLKYFFVYVQTPKIFSFFLLLLNAGVCEAVLVEKSFKNVTFFYCVWLLKFGGWIRWWSRSRAVRKIVIFLEIAQKIPIFWMFARPLWRLFSSSLFFPSTSLFNPPLPLDFASLPHLRGRGRGCRNMIQKSSWPQKILWKDFFFHLSNLSKRKNDFLKIKKYFYYFLYFVTFFSNFLRKLISSMNKVLWRLTKTKKTSVH